MRRSTHRVLGQLPLVLFCSLVSIATGTLCIALVALYHQEEAVLIVIACSTIIYGFLSLPLAILLKNNYWQVLFLKFFSVLCQLTILGAAIEYFNYTTKHAMKIESHLHKNLLIGLDSLLLCSFSINGFALGYPKELTDNPGQIKELGPHEPKPFYDKIDKYIPLKNSAQTLTPEMDPMRNTQQLPHGNVDSERCSNSAARSEERISNSPIVQPSPPPLNSPMSVTVENNGIGKIPKPKGAMRKNLKRPFIFRFSSSKGKIRKDGNIFEKRRNSISSMRENAREAITSDEDRCRLPTISDSSRSLANFNGISRNLNPQNGGIRTDFIIDPLHPGGASKPSSVHAIELETETIQRMNSALLPPCLKISEPLDSIPPSPPVPSSDLPLHTLTPVTPGASVDNSIERNGLEDIPQVPQLLDETTSNFLVEQDGPGIDIPLNVTLETWEKDKEIFLKRAAYWQSKSHNNNTWSKDENSHLLPAIGFKNEKEAGNSDISDYLREKNNFSFPLQKPLEIQNKFEDNNDDTISALEEYFRNIDGDEKRESCLIQDGLQYDNKLSPVQAPRFSRESHRSNDRHSPTKSIISIISGRESLGGNQRSQTILMNNNINGDYSYSPTRSSALKSSPTRSQRLKKMGKKLSLSNISDTMINTTGNCENNNIDNSEYKAHLKGGHIKGKSIDFSYIHSLQSNYSPNKSSPGFSPHFSIYKNRRSSISTDKDFNLTVDKPEVNTNIDANTNEKQSPNTRTVVAGTTMSNMIPSQNRIPSMGSSQHSAATTTNYPDIVMSEYDRERWNTLLNLRMVNSSDQFKAH